MQLKIGILVQSEYAQYQNNEHLIIFILSMHYIKQADTPRFSSSFKGEFVTVTELSQEKRDVDLIRRIIAAFFLAINKNWNYLNMVHR